MPKRESQLKYHMLTEYLKEEILMGRIKPNEKIPSENALAERFSLSRQTVRKSLAILVNEGFVYTEHGRGTFCADRTKQRSDSKNIGVVTTYISDYIFPKVIQGIDSVLSENGYSIMLKNTDNNNEKEAADLNDILQKDIEGIIIEPTKSALFSNNLAYYEALDENNIPYLFIHGYYYGLENKSYLILDDTAGMYSAVEYLVKLGHKDIVGIFKADDIQGVNRHKGYARAIKEAGLVYDPDHVIWFHTEDKDQTPYDQLKAILTDGSEVDAIACYNDQIAFKVFELLSSMDIKVPEDISLTGFDDSSIASNCPVKITTVRHPKEKFGEQAAEMLLKLLRDPQYLQNPLQETIIPELVIKDSCIKRN